MGWYTFIFRHEINHSYYYTTMANALMMMILQMEFQPSKKDAQTQNMKNCWPISVLFTFYSQADLRWPGLVAWANLAVVKDRK